MKPVADPAINTPSLANPEFKQVEKSYQRNLKLIKWRLFLINFGWSVWAIALGILLISNLVTFSKLAIMSSNLGDRSAFSLVSNASTLSLAATRAAPLPLSLGAVKITGLSADNKVLLSSIKNSNPDWIGRITYTFRYKEVETPVQSLLLSPNRARFGSAFGLSTLEIGSSPKLQIKTVTWERINRAQIKDPAAFLLERELLVAEDSQYLVVMGPGEIKLGEISFFLHNYSDYGYYEVPLLVTLYRGGQIIDAVKVVVNNLVSGELRPISYTLTGEVPLQAEVVVEPYLDWFDQMEYLESGGITL